MQASPDGGRKPTESFAVEARMARSIGTFDAVTLAEILDK